MVADTDSKPTISGSGEPRGVLPTGTQLRTYELLSVLGQGSFGITYRARDSQLDREVAIKEYLPATLAVRENGTFISPRSTEHAEEYIWGRERFLDEARTLAKLGDAPSIVRVYDFLEANGTAYTVMALVRGETLERRLGRGGRLGPAEINGLLHPLLDGLAQVHAIGFLHRDIKPANIIVDEAGAPTLIDFGASRLAMAARSGTMTAVFTPGYAAVEQFTSARQGPWTDIYGLAATLYHAITGQVPPSAYDRLLQDQYEPLERLHPAGFEPALLRAIDAGLAVRAADRPQSVADWRALLGAPTSAQATPARAAAATEVLWRGAGQRPQRPAAHARLATRPSLVAAAGALLLIAVAGAGYLLFRPASPTSVSIATPQPTVDRSAADAAARTKAEAEAALRQAEDAAQKKTAAEADTRRQAEALVRAQAELQKAKADADAKTTSGTLSACGQTVSFKIVAPGPDVALPSASFSGAWLGTWSNGVCGALVVESVAADGRVGLIYVVGASAYNAAGAWPWYGQISGDTLTTANTVATITYKLGGPDRLDGVYLQANYRATGSFSRKSLDGAVTQPPGK